MININSELKNNLVKMFDTNKNHVSREIARLASYEHHSPSYRRNGAYNFGAQQLVSYNSTNFYIIGVGGPSIVGS